MKPSWVRKVWDDCQTEEVLADTSHYDSHIVRPFYNLTFTSTSLSLPIKAEVMKLIDDNDGIYYDGFKSSSINVLIMDETGISSAKHRAAIRTNKVCLKPAWILDSCNAGYALAFDDYKFIEKPIVKVSTQCGGTSRTPANLDWTNVSGIGSHSTIDETVSVSDGTVSSANVIGK